MKRVTGALVGLLVASGWMTGCSSDAPATSDFCETVALFPPGASVAEAQKWIVRIEKDSPADIRDEVTILRRAVDAASTEEDLDDMDERGGAVAAATRAFELYVDEHCAPLD